MPVDRTNEAYELARAAASEEAWEDWVRPFREPIEGLCKSKDELKDEVNDWTEADLGIWLVNDQTRAR